MQIISSLQGIQIIFKKMQYCIFSFVSYLYTFLKMANIQLVPNFVDDPQKFVSSQEKHEPPVFYSWFGNQMPEDYLISLSQLNYPIIFLKNPKIQRKFSRQLMEIQKADYYRLQHLYTYGGIYSDFDNKIDYKCLLKLLEQFKKQENVLITMFDTAHNRKFNGEVMNNFIYAPKPQMPILKKILESVDQTKQKISGFAGLKFLSQFAQVKEIDMKGCVKHYKDYSWFEEQGEARQKSFKPHQKYIKKLVTKAEVMKQKQRLQNINEEEKRLNQKLKKQLIEKKLQVENKQLDFKFKIAQFEQKSSQYELKIQQLQMNKNLMQASVKQENNKQTIENNKNIDSYPLKLSKQSQRYQQLIKRRQQLKTKDVELEEKNKKIFQLQQQNIKLKQDYERQLQQITILNQILSDKTQLLKAKQQIQAYQLKLANLQSIQNRMNRTIQRENNIQLLFQVVAILMSLLFIAFLIKRLTFKGKLKTIKNINKCKQDYNIQKPIQNNQKTQTIESIQKYSVIISQSSSRT